MGFYRDISHYYDYIFPTGKEQVEFICRTAGSPPKNLLDIACGTGGYSIELAKAGYAVAAADIDAAMVEGLKSKLAGHEHKVSCVKAGMLELKDEIHSAFDLAFCIGNSVVHLNGEDEIRRFFKTARELVIKGGSFIVQIINFDRVILKNVRELPVLTNDEAGLRFERYYRYEKDSNTVYFKTILTVGNDRIENEIPLFPLLAEDAVNMLKGAGFERVEQFGDFLGNEFEKDNSYMLVLRAA